MLFKWLDTREATEVGVALADDLVLETGQGSSDAPPRDRSAQAQRRAVEKLLRRFLDGVDRRARSLPLNFFKRAKLANSFKWRLLEKGIARELADDLTQTLLLRLAGRPGSVSSGESRPAPPPNDQSDRLQALTVRGEACLARGESAEAVRCYRESLSLDPRNVAAGNNLGAALFQLGRNDEAEAQFRRSMSIKPSRANDRSRLQVALKVNLSSTLVLQGRLREAKTLLESALKTSPRHVDALIGIGQIAGFEGRFAEAEALFRRAAEVDPKSPRAWATQVLHRRMTAADAPWLERAEEIAARELAPLDEAHLRYAIGKYHDDLGEFERAFHSHRRANELQKSVAEPYDRKARTRFVEDMTRVYTREDLARERLGLRAAGVRDRHAPLGDDAGRTDHSFASGRQVRGRAPFLEHGDAPARPGAPTRAHRRAARRRAGRGVFARSGTALAGCAAGHRQSDLQLRVPRSHSSRLSARSHHLPSTRPDRYVPVLLPPAALPGDELRDGPVGPGALLPCASASGRSLALPAGTLLDVPYEGLIADQERWSRRIIEFVGLEWHPRCLEFHRTDRVVMTASYWQVRQSLYTTSVGRWRNYRSFIGPLLELRDPGLERP